MNQIIFPNQIPKLKEKIVYVSWGVANVFRDGIIEIHKDLRKNEWNHLKEKILKHEKKHDFKKGFFYNFIVDFFSFVCIMGLLKFMIMRPSTWIQFSPFYFHPQRGFVYDKNLFLFYLFVVFVIFIIIKLGGLI